MRYLSEQEKHVTQQWMDEAATIAQQATCTRAKCGAVIVKDGEVIGRGFNSPPGDDENQRRCGIPKDSYDKKVTDKTCCVHAEQRAVMDALRRNAKKLLGSTMYFVRLDGEGNMRTGEALSKPYCTICSKMILDTGISEFVLRQHEGMCAYETGEYNEVSYKYGE